VKFDLFFFASRYIHSSIVGRKSQVTGLKSSRLAT
jgi:hypothetical protein